MKLFLASEDEDSRTLKALSEYIGGFNNKKCAFIPTATNGSNPLGYPWQNRNAWKVVNSTGMKVKPIVLEDYKKTGVDIKAFTESDIIWVTGGSGGYLMYWIRRVGMDRIIPDLIKKMVYFGGSSGCWVTGKDLNIAEWFIGGEERGASVFKGMGLVDFDIYPHYEDSLYDKIKEKYKGKKLYLLKDGEEIIVEDDKIEVIGEERIIAND